MKNIICLAIAIIICGCKTSNKTTTPSILENQLQLDLADKMNPKTLEANFSTLGVKYLCTLDTEKNICVFAFDTERRTKEEIIHFLGLEVGVESASPTTGCPQKDKN